MDQQTMIPLRKYSQKSKKTCILSSPKINFLHNILPWIFHKKNVWNTSILYMRNHQIFGTYMKKKQSIDQKQWPHWENIVKNQKKTYICYSPKINFCTTFYHEFFLLKKVSETLQFYTCETIKYLQTIKHRSQKN